jgi:hypothetical protein
MTENALQSIDSTKVRYRYFRVLDNVIKYNGAAEEHKQQAEHVLTVASYLDNDKIYVGFSVNRVPRVDKNALWGDKCNCHDKFSAEIGRKIALGRLMNGRVSKETGKHARLEIVLDPSKKIVRNIIDGLLAADSTSVPHAVKHLLRKNIVQFNNKS